METRDAVKQKYAQAAGRVRSGSDEACCSATSSCSSDRDPITSNLYDELQRSELPQSALLASLGCSNPTALAGLRPGETVLTWGVATALMSSFPRAVFPQAAKPTVWI